MALILRNLRRSRAIRVVGIDGSPAMLKVAMARDPDIEWRGGRPTAPKKPGAV